MTQNPPEFQRQMQHPPPPVGYITTAVTAWESVPKFIRFVVWLYAVLTVIGLAVTFGGALLLMLAATV